MILLLLGCSAPSSKTDGSLLESGADTAVPLPPVSAGLTGLAELGVHNVIVVHADTLRADRLSLYGSPHDTLPLVGGEPWVVMDEVYAPTSWTIPSSVSMLTALDPVSHGILHMTAGRTLNAELEAATVASALVDRGFATAAWAGNQALPQVDGVFDGFEHLDETYEGAWSSSMGWEVTNTLDWIDTLPEEQPFFVFLQPMDAHTPYSPDAYLGTWSDPDALPFDVGEGVAEEAQTEAFKKEWAKADEAGRAALLAQLQAIYDEDILSIDASMADLFAGLEARGLADDTLVVLAGDHGETLAEEDDNGHVFFGHGGKVRQELVHVPIAFHHPRLESQHLDCLAQNYDLMPTLFTALGLAPLEGVDGQPLQDGCRTVVHASTWFANVDTDRIKEVLSTDGVGALRWDCDHELVYRYDLLSDPTGVVSVEMSELPGGDWLEDDIDEFLDLVDARLAPVNCDLRE